LTSLSLVIILLTNIMKPDCSVVTGLLVIDVRSECEDLWAGQEDLSANVLANIAVLVQGANTRFRQRLLAFLFA